MAKIPDGYVFILTPEKKGMAVDVEQRELVTCQHCKHYKPYKGRVSGNQYFQCEELFMDTEPDWYCAYGESN